MIVVRFVPASWEEVAGFVPAAFTRSPELVAAVERQVKEGEAACFLAMGEGGPVGGLVVDGDGATLRVLALSGDNGAGLISAMDAFVRDMARAAACTRVVAHTTRPGMVIQAARHGWALDLATVSVGV